jgi:group I intron endonuclease
MPWTIYCHTHIDSGRRYIGLTKKTWKQRWNQHVYMSNRVKRGYGHFPNAIRKYGKDAFSHEVLEICDDLDFANEREEYWITRFDTRNPEKGFNLARGGSHTPHPKKNPWDRPEFREKQLKLLKERWEDPAFRSKMANIATQTSKNPAWRAKVRDPEDRARRSSVSRALWKDPEFRKKCIKDRLKPTDIKSVSVEEKPVPGKLCCRCNGPGIFGKDRHTKDGFRRTCKKCEKIARQAKKEERRLRDKKYRDSNKEKIQIYQAEYYKKNHERITNRDRSRREEINNRVSRNKEKLRVMVNKIKSVPCQECGRLKKPDEMDFYRPGFGYRSVHWLINHNTSKERVLEEIDKCEILCIECFRDKTNFELRRTG